MSERICVMCGKPVLEERMVCHKCEDVERSLNTTIVAIRLNKITDIGKFINLVSKCQDDVVVKSGNFAVNAKSIMGLLSLDLSNPVKIEFYGDIPCEVKEGMKKFIVN